MWWLKGFGEGGGSSLGRRGMRIVGERI